MIRWWLQSIHACFYCFIWFWKIFLWKFPVTQHFHGKLLLIKVLDKLYGASSHEACTYPAGRGSLLVSVLVVAGGAPAGGAFPVPGGVLALGTGFPDGGGLVGEGCIGAWAEPAAPAPAPDELLSLATVPFCWLEVAVVPTTHK